MSDALLAYIALIADVDWELVEKIIGWALGGGLLALLGGFGTWYLRILQQKQKMAKESHVMEMEKLKLLRDQEAARQEHSREKREQEEAAERRSKRDNNKETRELLKVYKEEKESDRKQIHDLRDDLYKHKLRLEICERGLEEGKRQLELCEDDKSRLKDTIADLGQRIKALEERNREPHA